MVGGSTWSHSRWVDRSNRAHTVRTQSGVDRAAPSTVLQGVSDSSELQEEAKSAECEEEAKNAKP